MDAREAVLGRVRSALGDAAQVPVPRDYVRAGRLPSEQRLAHFVERVRDYGAEVIRTGDPAAAVAALGGWRLGIPADLPPALRPPGCELVADDGLAPRELDALDGALTCCAAACAATGTVALDGGPGQGRRALSLVPDLHVCVVRAEQVVETVAELVAALEPAASAGRPVVLVSGPSATSDIELSRVEGVHGPRRLVVVLTASGT